MKCRDCKFLSEPEHFGSSEFPSVRCTLGLWDKDYDNPPDTKQYYSYGSAIRNRGPIKKHGEVCTRGENKNGT